MRGAPRRCWRKATTEGLMYGPGSPVGIATERPAMRAPILRARVRASGRPRVGRSVAAIVRLVSGVIVVAGAFVAIAAAVSTNDERAHVPSLHPVARARPAGLELLPLAARGVVSGTVGAGDGGYR